jgi:hypothetical protein
MTAETALRIDSTMIALRALRRAGVIPPDAPASPALMSWVSVEIGQPVSKATFHRVNRQALVAARLALQAHLAKNP